MANPRLRGYSDAGFENYFRGDPDGQIRRHLGRRPRRSPGRGLPGLSRPGLPRPLRRAPADDGRAAGRDGPRRRARSRAEWEEETGGDGGLTAAFDSATRNAVLDEEGRRRRGAVPRRRRARHRTDRGVAVRDGLGRRGRQHGRGDRRQPRAQPLARGLRSPGTRPAHRRRGDPGDHPRHGHRARAGARGEGARPPRASSSRPAGSTGPRTTTRGTSRCGRSPKSSAWCCTRTPARARATSASVRGCCRSTRRKPAGGRRARSRC